MPFTLSICLALSMAQTPKAIDIASFDRLAMDSLRAVHDRGAKLFNDDKDYAGCVRLYEGAVRTIHPLLSHHPKTQTRIDNALRATETEANPRTNAFRLHELIEAVRGDLRDSAKPVIATVKETAPMPTPRMPLPSPAPVPLSGLPTPTTVAILAMGRLTLDGKPAADCELQFVSLDQSRPVIRTVRTDTDGRFRIDSPLPGRYAVTAAGRGVPVRYHATNESGIKVVISLLPTPLDLNLKN